MWQHWFTKWTWIHIFEMYQLSHQRSVCLWRAGGSLGDLGAKVMDTGEIMGGHYRGSLYRETRAFPLLSDSAYQPTPALVCPSCDLPNTVWMKCLGGPVWLKRMWLWRVLCLVSILPLFSWGTERKSITMKCLCSHFLGGCLCVLPLNTPCALVSVWKGGNCEVLGPNIVWNKAFMVRVFKLLTGYCNCGLGVKFTWIMCRKSNRIHQFCSTLQIRNIHLTERGRCSLLAHK